MKSEETKPLLCPFCGAPQRRHIPTGALQIKCQYCGGIFSAPSLTVGETYRCFNHTERLAVGKCNDCAKSFCGNCLHVYKLHTESESATLYLCADCLRKRHVEKADINIYVGIIFLLLGVFTLLSSVPFGVFIMIIGACAILYGVSKKAGTPEELTISELRGEEEKREAELAATGGIDTEEIYNKLLKYYVSHWGATTGIELLENEIMAYVRHGASFPEAVEKVYQRQAKKIS